MIGYYVHHHGRGHLQRLLAVAEHLATPVTGLSSLAAPPGWAGDWVRLRRDDEPPPPGTGAEPTARGALHWAPLLDPGLRERMAGLARWVERSAPTLLVVDVSVEVALLGRLLGVPVALMGMLGDRTDPPHRLALDVADVVVAPWPQGLVPEPDGWRGRTVHVGAFSRFDGRDRGPDRRSGPDGDRRVLVLWGAGGDDVSAAQWADARAATPGWRWTYRTGSAGGTGDDVWPDLLAADVVVVHGGNNAVAEVAAARRPAVVVAQDRPFDEQGHRARVLDAAGIATGLPRWPDASRWPALLLGARARGGGEWSRWSDGAGAARAAAALDEVAARDRGRP